MARYSIKNIEFILKHYWDLKEGNIPKEPGVPARRYVCHGPQETALVWVADIDNGIDGLDSKRPGRWLHIAHDIDMRRLERVKWKLNYRQQSVIRYYLLGRTDEARRAYGAVKLLRQLLNEKD